MKILTLDFLDCIYNKTGTCRTPSEQMIKDPVFSGYVQLAYSNKVPNYKIIPVHKRDPLTPLGYDFSNLQMAFKKFYQSAYEINDNKLSRKLLIQVAESLSKVEVKFLREVLKGKIGFYPKQQYLKDQADANL